MLSGEITLSCMCASVWECLICGCQKMHQSMIELIHLRKRNNRHVHRHITVKKKSPHTKISHLL